MEEDLDIEIIYNFLFYFIFIEITKDYIKAVNFLKVTAFLCNCFSTLWLIISK